MNIFKRGLIWMKVSMEGDDGRPSHRKLTTFVFVILIVYMTVYKIKNQLELNAYYALLISVGVLIGIVTIGDILKFFGRGGQDKDEKMTGVPVQPVVEQPPIKQGDEITATITDIKTP